MKAERSRGMKGRVIVTVSNEEAREEITVYREGRLGLAFRLPSHHLLKPAAQQLRSSNAMIQGTRTSVAQS